MTTDEIDDIIRRLHPYYSADEARKWLHSPHPQLDGWPPYYRDHAEVVAIIDRLDSGAYL